MKQFSVYFLMILLAVVISCKPKQNMVYLEENNNQQAEINQAIFEGTRIQSGDILTIQVSAFDEYAIRPFNVETAPTSNSNSVNGGQISGGTSNSKTEGYQVDSNGDIVFPVLGRLHIQGMTTKQLREDLEERLKKYLTDPFVTIRQQNFNITVLGEVKSPGQFTSGNEKLNVLQVLGLAGDMTDFADRTNVKLIREEDGIAKTYVLNFNDASLTSSPLYYVQQNDILYVQPDDNKKVLANNNPNRNLWFQIGGAALGVLTLIISLTR